MRYALYLVALLIAGLPAIALAQDQPERSVQTLYIDCKEESGINLGSCLGYLLGVADIMVALGQVEAQAEGKPIKSRICDASYTTGSLRQIFINWAEKYPQLWTEDKLVGAAQAFQETWPCPQDLLRP